MKRSRWLLLLLLSSTCQPPPAHASTAQVNCQDGCNFFAYSGPGAAAPYVLVDDGTNCDVACPVGQLYYTYDQTTWTTVPNNIIGCDCASNANRVWCTAQGSTQQLSVYVMCNGTTNAIPIVRGDMSSCTEIADTAPTVVDCTKFTDPTAEATCNSAYGGTIQVNCQDGCNFFSYTGPGAAAPYVLVDDGTNCDVACPVGQLYYTYDQTTWTTVPNNIIGCDCASNANRVWCTAQGSTQQLSVTLMCNGTANAIPIVRGDMSSCTEIADTAPTDVDCSTYTDPTAEATCNSVYTTTTTTTSTTSSTTTTSPSTSTESTTTSTTSLTTITSTSTSTEASSSTGTTTTDQTTPTTTGTTGTRTTTTGTGTTATGTGTTTTGTGTTTTGTTNTGTTTSTTAATGTTTTTPASDTTQESGTTTEVQSAPMGLCAPFIAANGVLYDNRCAQFDAGATCNDDGEQSTCTCSAGQTGSICGVTQTSLQLIAPLAGATADAQSIYDMIVQSKRSGTAIFTSNLPSLLASLSDAQKADLSFTATDTIIDATYEDKALNIDAAFTSFYDPSLGNCFTFNHWNKSFHYGARMIGPSGGLKVQLNIMPEEYLPFIDTMGINVYVTQIGEHVYVESNKIMSQPGGWDKIVLTRTTTKLLKTYKSKCAEDTSSAQSYYFDGNYSIDGCYRSCYQDACYAACGCMDPMYARKDGVAACTFEQVPCILEMQERRGDPSTWDECRCYQPCFSQDYSILYSRGLLTTQIICAQTGNYNATDSCKPSQSYVTVGFRTLEALVQVEVPRFPLSHMFGNLGNVGGLLLGFSMVALFEWLLFAIKMFLFIIKKEEYGPSAGEIVMTHSEASFRGLWMLPILTFCFAALAMIVPSIIGRSNGHLLVTVPFISDGGALYPENGIFTFFFSLTAFSLTLTLFIRHVQLLQYYGSKRKDVWWRHASAMFFILGVFASLSIIFMTCYNEKVNLTLHLSGAFCAFGVGTAVVIGQFVLSVVLKPRIGHTFLIPVRIVLCIAIIVCFFMFASGMGAVPEWILSFSFIVFVLTFSSELYDIDNPRLILYQNARVEMPIQLQA